MFRKLKYFESQWPIILTTLNPWSFVPATTLFVCQCQELSINLFHRYRVKKTHFCCMITIFGRSNHLCLLLLMIGLYCLYLSCFDQEPSPSPEPKVSYIKFPGEDYVRKFKRHYRTIPTPDPDDCILEIVNTQLVVSHLH